MDIYVGNLAYSTNDESLKSAFGAYGEVSSARVVSDRMTGRSKGFGFVEMPDRAQAQAAIDALNGKELDGRTLRVNESQPKPREERGGGGGGGGGFRGGPGGGGGGFRGGAGGGRGGAGGRGGERRESRW
jgi:RNA recognition motif-containing protein